MKKFWVAYCHKMHSSIKWFLLLLAFVIMDGYFHYKTDPTIAFRIWGISFVLVIFCFAILLTYRKTKKNAKSFE